MYTYKYFEGKILNLNKTYINKKTSSTYSVTFPRVHKIWNKYHFQSVWPDIKINLWNFCWPRKTLMYQIWYLLSFTNTFIQHISKMSMVHIQKHVYLFLKSTVSCNPTYTHFYYFNFVQVFLYITEQTCHATYINLN